MNGVEFIGAYENIPAVGESHGSGLTLKSGNGYSSYASSSPSPSSSPN